jgi:DNA-3-methyladenine glycosylase I
MTMESGAAGITRCEWANSHPLLAEYHDTEWGVPLHVDRTHFEYMVLDGAQAGLSWLTVLKKREGYRAAFAGFDPEAVARFTDEDTARLLADPGIIRNRQKVASAVTNARCFLEVQKEFGSFDDYIWQFTGGETIVVRPAAFGEVRATSPESDAMSKALLKRGFKFVGSTICYAYMQAAGMINDHTADCFRSECHTLTRSPQPRPVL